MTFRAHPETAPPRIRISSPNSTAAGAPARAERVRDAVLAVRGEREWCIDEADPDTRSVGSFFMNPIVDLRNAQRFGELRPSPHHVPGFRAARETGQGSGRVADRARRRLQRGLLNARAACRAKHPLAIVNREAQRRATSIRFWPCGQTPVAD